MSSEQVDEWGNPIESSESQAGPNCGDKSVNNKKSTGDDWGGGCDNGGWGDKPTSNNQSTGGGGWGDESTSNNQSTGGGGWGDESTSNNQSTGGGGWGDEPSSSNKSTGGGGWGDGATSTGDDGWGGNSKPHGDWKGKPRSDDQNGNEEGGEERPAPYKPEELDLNEEAKLQADGVGENFHRYKEQKVICYPDIIEPIEKFEDVIESKLLLSNVKNLNYNDLTPIQKWAMPAIVKGYDLIGCAQTGSGKTAAFLLPILQTILKSDLDKSDPNDDCQNPYCLVVSPTRELAKQIYTHAEMLSRDSLVKCQVIYGGIATFHLKAKMCQGCHVLVATPGRLKDFVQKGWIGFKNIKFIVLDEGDRLVDDGFMEDIRAFFAHETMSSSDQRQTLFFSATFKEEIQNNAREYLKESKTIFLTVGRVGSANLDIKQEFIEVTRTEKKRRLKALLNSVDETEKTIVFTQTKSGADMLATFFTALGLSSTSIHGDRHQSQREQAISSFKRGERRFLISSPVGNRGLDLPKVAIVINYDLPNNIEEYVHRIGRTGRAGHTGKAISFYDPERDSELIPDLLNILEEAKQEIPDWMKDSGQAKVTSGAPTTGDTVDDAEDWGSATVTTNSSDKKTEDVGENASDPCVAGSSGNTKASGEDDWGLSGADSWGTPASSPPKEGGWDSGQQQSNRGSSRGSDRPFNRRHGDDDRGSRNNQWDRSNSDGRSYRGRGNRGGFRGGSNQRSNDNGWNNSSNSTSTDNGGWGSTSSKRPADDQAGNASKRYDNSNSGSKSNAPEDDGWSSGW